MNKSIILVASILMTTSLLSQNLVVRPVINNKIYIEDETITSISINDVLSADARNHGASKYYPQIVSAIQLGDYIIIYYQYGSEKKLSKSQTIAQESSGYLINVYSVKCKKLVHEVMMEHSAHGIKIYQNQIYSIGDGVVFSFGVDEHDSLIEHNYSYDYCAKHKACYAKYFQNDNVVVEYSDSNKKINSFSVPLSALEEGLDYRETISCNHP